MSQIELGCVWIDNVRSDSTATAPLLVNRDPSPGEIGAPRSPVICLDIVDIRAPVVGITTASTTIYVNGVTAWSAGAAQPGFQGAQSTSSYDGTTHRVCVDCESTYNSEATITVRVTASTTDALNSDDTYTFIIEDYEAPVLVSATGSGRREVGLSFDETVIVTDGTGFIFSMIGSTGVQVAAVSAVSSGSLVTVTLDKDITPGIIYSVTAIGVEDLSGNAVSPPNDTASFTSFKLQQPDGRTFDLWRFVPEQTKADDISGDLRGYIDVAQEQADLILTDIDLFCTIYSIEDASSNFVDLMLVDLGNPFNFDLDDTRKRRLAASLVDIYKSKGTAQGIIDVINFFFGVLVDVEALRGYSMILGESELAWPASDTSAVGTFDTEDGRTLNVSVNGVAKVVTFSAVDVVDIHAITAEEAASIITIDLVDAVGVDLPSGAVQIRTVEQSGEASIQVTGGTAFAAFAFSGDASVGGGDFILGSGDRRLLYSFRIVSPVEFTDEDVAQITAIVDFMKPAHTHLTEIVWPMVPEDLDHILLGLSALGDNAELH